MPEEDAAVGAAGASTALVVSPEALGRQVYRGLLGRDADELGLAHFVETVRAGGAERLGALLTGFTRSDEFRARCKTSDAAGSFLHPGGDPDLLVLDFSDARSERCLGQGWYGREPSWVWAAGQNSLLQFDTLAWQDGALLILEVTTSGHPQVRPTQRLNVFVNEIAVGDFAVSHRRPATLVCEVPAHALMHRIGMSIRLHHPDAMAPSRFPEGHADDRELSYAIRELRLRRLTPALRQQRSDLAYRVDRPLASSTVNPLPKPDLAYSTLVSHFESLGHNCEFGFVQREAGSEAISLLRFTGIPLHKLLRGLRNHFADIAAPGRFHLDVLEHLPDEGYIGCDDSYLIYYHTTRDPKLVLADELLLSEPPRLRYLARKLIEDIEDGEKIFVVKNDEGLPLDTVIELLELLAGIGRSLLLWIDLASPDHPAGSVDVLRPGLMKGYIDRFSDLDIGPSTISYACWRGMLEHVYAMKEIAAHAVP